MLWLHVAIAIASLVDLLTTKLNPTWLIVTAAAVGTAARALGH